MNSDSSVSSCNEEDTASRSVRILVKDEPGPVLVSFPGGLPAALQANSFSEFPTFHYDNQHGNKTTLFGKDEACFYSATVSEDEHTKQSVSFCVGLFDKQKNTLTLSQADCHGTVFALSQSVRNYQMHTESAMEARLSLVQDFSSAKKQKVLRSQAANRVKADHVVGSGKLMMNGVKQTMSDSNQKAMLHGEGRQQQNVAILQATDAWRNDFLPPFDETASEAHKVYKAKKIVSKDSWKQAGRVVAACTHKDDVAMAIMDVTDTVDDSIHENKTLHKYKWFTTVEDLIHRLCREPRQNLDIERLQSAILVNHFGTLYDGLEKRRFFQPPSPDRSRFFGVPVEFALYFTEKFTTSTIDQQGREARVMSKTDKDRCMIHLLILYVFAEAGNSMRASNIKPLLDDLKQDLTHAIQLLRQAGFTVERKSGTSTTSVALKTPLTFPSGIRKRAPKSDGR